MIGAEFAYSDLNQTIVVVEVVFLAHFSKAEENRVDLSDYVPICAHTSHNARMDVVKTEPVEYSHTPLSFIGTGSEGKWGAEPSCCLCHFCLLSSLWVLKNLETQIIGRGK